ncbi:MAG: IclR family transcriptional regulator [Chloroflexi bacterium]|nr:IclR family transcriptional regulator [Chloroflexota bacterium]
MINSVVKAARLLALFSPAEPRLTLSEISTRLGMPKSTAHHLLNTLLAVGFIEKVDGDSYALGAAIIALTQNVRVNVELRDRAAPLLRHLADSCHESVYLTTCDGDQVLYIYAIESSQRLLARTAVGDRAPLHCTAVGKAILAQLPPDRVAEIAERRGLPGFTATTRSDLAALAVDLEATRARGYAVDDQEHEPETYCLGAPIFDAQGAVIGACSISGSDPAIIAGRVRELAPKIMHTAQEISRRMGYVPATTALVNFTEM